MKKFNALLFSVALSLCVISFASCSDDDDDEVTPPAINELEGKWNLATDTLEITCNPADSANTVWTYLLPIYKKSIPVGNYEFSTDSKYTFTPIEGTAVEGTYKVTGSKLTLTVVTPKANLVPTTSTDYTFEVKDNALTLKYDLTANSKEKMAVEKVWEDSIKTAKPEKFELTQSVRINKHTKVTDDK